MKVVLYVSPVPPPAGGIGTWTRILLERGLPDGWRPVVADTSPGPGRSVFQRASLAAELRRAARVLRDFGRKLRSERPAAVHVNVDATALGFVRDGLCALWARWHGVPALVHYRGLLTPLRTRSLAWRSFVGAVGRRVDLNLVLNRDSHDVLRELGCREIQQVPNYFDDRAIPDRTVEPRAPGERLQVAFVGGLTAAKGTAEVLRTAQHVPEADFHLLGQRYPETDALLEGTAPQVHVYGEVSHDEVLQRLAASHVFLFPTRHREGFPNVVCEAMALGLAVIATPVGAIPEMVEEGRGGFILPAEPARLAEALRQLDGDDATRVAMGRFNQEKARRDYRYERVVGLLTAIYQRCIEARAEERTA